MTDPAFLSRISLLAGLSPAELSALGACIYERKYRKGTIVFSQGDPGEAAYFVRSGRVKVYRLAPDGQEQIMGLFSEAQPFGLVAALDGSTYPATAEAVEDSLILVLRRTDLQQLIERHPGLSMGIIGEMGARLRTAQGRVHSLSARSVRQRVAEFLLDEVQRQGGPNSRGMARIKMGMTHQELGSYLGATRESVTRSFADLRRETAIKLEHDDTITVDVGALTQWLEP